MRSACSNRKFSGSFQAEPDHNKQKIMRAFNESLIVQQAIPGNKEKVFINGIIKLQSSKTKTKNTLCTNGDKASMKVVF